MERDLDKVTRSERSAAGRKPEGEDDEDAEEESPDVVDRKDAEDAAHVESAEVVRGAAGIEENTTDQEAGEDEKKINAIPTGGEGTEHAVNPKAEWGVFGSADVMAKNDEGDGESAEAVELGDAGGGGRSRGHGVRVITLHWQRWLPTPV